MSSRTGISRGSVFEWRTEVRSNHEREWINFPRLIWEFFVAWRRNHEKVKFFSWRTVSKWGDEWTCILHWLYAIRKFKSYCPCVQLNKMKAKEFHILWIDERRRNWWFWSLIRLQTKYSVFWGFLESIQRWIGDINISSTRWEVLWKFC